MLIEPQLPFEWNEVTAPPRLSGVRRVVQELDEEDEDWALPEGVDPLLAATELYSDTTAQVGAPPRALESPVQRIGSAETLVGVQLQGHCPSATLTKLSGSRCFGVGAARQDASGRILMRISVCVPAGTLGWYIGVSWAGAVVATVAQRCLRSPGCIPASPSLAACHKDRTPCT